jgi:hypothetical protein
MSNPRAMKSTMEQASVRKRAALTITKQARLMFGVTLTGLTFKYWEDLSGKSLFNNFARFDFSKTNLTEEQVVALTGALEDSHLWNDTRAQTAIPVAAPAIELTDNPFVIRVEIPSFSQRLIQGREIADLDNYTPKLTNGLTNDSEVNESASDTQTRSDNRMVLPSRANMDVA